MENTGDQSRPLKTQLIRSLLGGLIMSVCAVIIWFILSTPARKIGLAIFCALLALIIINYLFFALVKHRHKAIKILLRCLLILLSAVTMLSVTVYTLSSSQLFYPNFDKASYDALQKNSSAEELNITAGGQTISGWMLHNADGKAPLVLYFGGNGESSSKRVRAIIDKSLQSMFNGYNFAYLDYPGYGKSSGSPSEESLKDMGATAFDAMCKRSDVDPDRIVVFGYSMGTGVANYVASNRHVAGLVLMAPYADGYDLYNGMVNIFHGPMRLLVGFRMESVRFAEDVSIKPLILASKSDEFVGYESSVRLSKAYPAGCQFETYDDFHHNDFWGSDAVHKRISEYLMEVQQNG